MSYSTLTNDQRSKSALNIKDENKTYKQDN
jgi:hypothetical protein